MIYCYTQIEEEKHINRKRLFMVYYQMIRRCYKSNDLAYDNYGARGISVCDEWLNNWYAFRDWALANGYRDDLTIDRINNDGNYEPANCRWATRKEQSHNTRKNNHRITAFGETKSLFEWLDDSRCVVSCKVLRRRLFGRSDWKHMTIWTPEDALTTPIEKHNPVQYITAFNECKTINMWAKDNRCVVGKNKLYKRINEGWEPEKALTQPTRVINCNRSIFNSNQSLN